MNKILADQLKTVKHDLRARGINYHKDDEQEDEDEDDEDHIKFDVQRIAESPSIPNNRSVKKQINLTVVIRNSDKIRVKRVSTVDRLNEGSLETNSSTNRPQKPVLLEKVSD